MPGRRVFVTGLGFVSPNLTVPDPASDLDYVAGVGRDAPDLEVALSNSFAFGGSNATLVLRRV